MEGFKNILVATDYSPCADYALGCAAELAGRIGAQLVIVHVVPAPTPKSDPSNLWGSGEDTVKKEAERLAEHVAGVLAGAGVRYAVAATWGSPAAAIIDTARERGSDLIVMGAHGTSRSTERVLGSVADRVVRYAPCAVLTVRAAEPAPPASPPPEHADATSARSGPSVETVVRQVPITITQYETLAAAHALMVRHGIHQLPVVEGGALIGILAERDLHAHVGYWERTKVDAAMTRAPITVAPADSAQHAAHILIEQNINALPVVQDDRLVGIVSRTDLLRLLTGFLDVQQRESGTTDIPEHSGAGGPARSA